MSSGKGERRPATAAPVPAAAVAAAGGRTRGDVAADEWHGGGSTPHRCRRGPQDGRGNRCPARAAAGVCCRKQTAGRGSRGTSRDGRRDWQPAKMAAEARRPHGAGAVAICCDVRKSVVLVADRETVRS